MNRKARPGRGWAKRGWTLAFYVYCAAILAFLVVPLLVVFPISFSSSTYLQFPPPGYSLRWYVEFFSDPGWIEATWRSLKIALLTAALATVMGTLIAFSLVRGRYPGKKILEQLVAVPMIVPSIVYAVSVYSLFSSMKLVGRWEGIALAHTVHALPLVVLVVSSSLRTFDASLEQAARGLGASRIAAVLHVTLPHMRPALISGAFIAFISSFDELVVAMFLSGVNVTLPTKMYDSIIDEIDPTIAAVSVMQIALVVLCLVIIWKCGGKHGSPRASEKSVRSNQYVEGSQ